MPKYKYAKDLKEGDAVVVERTVAVKCVIKKVARSESTGDMLVEFEDKTVVAYSPIAVVQEAD